MKARSPWVMLVALASAFALSQAFRTVTAMMARQLQADFALSPQQLGVFAGTFHLMFGAMQVFMGVGIDMHGIRRTILAAFPLAVAGAALSAFAPGFGAVLAGQALIGIGCAPAFLVCTVFIARRFPVERFASVSGTVMALGGIGMLLTATPLAWVVEHSSWRTGFALLAIGAAAAWLAVFLFVPAEPERAAAGESVVAAIGQFGALLRMPHTWGIVALASVTYASFITLRGLWLGPLLVERYGLSLVASGNVALAVSCVSLFGPPLFGRWDPGVATRRRFIIAMTGVTALLFALLAFTRSEVAAIALAVLIAFVTGYIVLQYADVRGAYPPALTGRAMAVLTMAMFLGIAVMQWLTGAVATWFAARGVETFEAVMMAVALLLAAGAAAFRWLPAPAR